MRDEEKIRIYMVELQRHVEELIRLMDLITYVLDFGDEKSVIM